MKNYTVTGGTLSGPIPHTFLGGWTSIKFKRLAGDPAFSFDINMEHGGTAGHIEFPALSSTIIQGDLNCKKWIAAGCITYTLPLSNLQHIPQGGNGVGYIVRGMVPKVPMHVGGQINFTIDEYPTQSDEQRIILGTQIDSNPRVTTTLVKHWGDPPPMSALVNSQATTAATGIVQLTLGIDYCYWADPVNTTPHTPCHVTAPQTSLLTLDSLTTVNSATDLLIAIR
jgi:hypothetical protein